MSVSIQQAACNALATFLASKMTDATVAARWPSPDRPLPRKAITVVTAGSRRDIPIERKLLQSANVGDASVDSVWQIAACTQPLQLDIWAHSDFERDAMMADLDIYLNYGETGLGVGNYDVGSGLLLNVENGWDDYDTTADFAFEESSTEDSSDAVGVASYRATYRGNVHVMLAVPSTSPRQILINFTQFLDGETDADAITYSTDD